MSQLVVAMTTSNGPISTQLINEKPDSSDEWYDLAESMARRISHKFQIQAFVSEHLNDCRREPMLLALTEKLVVQKLLPHFPLSSK